MEEMSDRDLNRWVEGRLAELTPPNEWRPDVPGALARLRQRRGPERMVSPLWMSVAVAVIAGCLSAFPAPRGIAKRCLKACESLFVKSVGGDRGTILHNEKVRGAPDFILRTSSGEDIQLSRYKGKVVLLNFWATWCGPCQVEIPWFSEFQQTYSDQGFIVIGASMDEDGWTSVMPYIRTNKINYRVGIAGQQIAQAYGGVETLPETLLIDRDGKIVARHVGLVSKREYEDEILQVLERK
jgi:thiol-disulfide isomerase/thioredoxin